MVDIRTDARRASIVALATGLALLLPAFSAAQTLAAGSAHSVVLKSDGTVWTFGYNAYGELGIGTAGASVGIPTQVSGLSGVVAVAAGAHHSLALTSTGDVFLWGSNTDGRLGDGTTTHRNMPVQSSLANVVAIAAGEHHSVALTSGGVAYAWGRNTNGQLGTGSTTSSLVPVQVATDIGAIGAGTTHTLFVKTDGTVLAAGSNGYGQLGDGSTTQRTSPVPMSGITTAAAAAGGSFHSVILLTDGTLKATGYNGRGNLGDGTTTQRTTPVAVASLTNATNIAVGSEHALARNADGTVWAWGRNVEGQLGDGTTTNRTSPVAVSGLSSVSAIAAGYNHSVAVSAAGVVYTWGLNSALQLGDGTTVSRSLPEAISGPDYEWKVSTPTLSIASGTYNTDRTVVIAVATPGATIHYTQNGAEPTESDPTIVAGSSLTVNVSQMLKAKAWKASMPPSNVATAAYDLKVALPTVTPSGGTFGVAQTVSIVSATSGAALRYTTDGSTPTAASTLYTVPLSVGTTTTLKVLGFKTDWTTSDLRTTVITMNFGTLTAPTASVATGSYVDAVTVNLSAMSGAVIRYTINNTTPNSNSPLYVAPLTLDVTTTLLARAFHFDYTASAVSTWTYTMAAAAPEFSPTAGTYSAGQVITVTAPSVSSVIRYTLNGAEPTIGDPVISSGASLVAGNYTLKAKAWKTGADPSAVASATFAVTGQVADRTLVAASEYSLALRHDGIVWGWGMNSSGQTGDGTTNSPRFLPKMVAGLAGATLITGGSGQSLATRQDGTLVAWGQNGGRLGDGTTTSRTSPVTIASSGPVDAVNGGDEHTLGVQSDGTAWAWGSNVESQLGDGTTTQRLVPTVVSGLTNVSEVAAGFRFSLALKQDGTVWAWGRNQNGQLGDGTTTLRSTPVVVSAITTATAISAGKYHALALLADGTVVSWGRNASGELGDGTKTDRAVPVPVAGLANIVHVSAGGDFSLAVDSSGSLWTWGGNGAGQLGDGTANGRLLAAPVTSLSNIVHASAGGGHVLALAADGTVWAWGRNTYGQLGDGTATNRSTPYAISGPGMNWKVATPIVSLATGQYTTTQLVTVTVADADATLRYTTTGLDPTMTDATVASGGTIAVDQSLTLKVDGWKPGAPTSVVVARTYELKAQAPTMTPETGAYTTGQSVVLATATPGATLRYTIDGSEPAPSSPVYGTALTIAETLTLKARAYRHGWTPSDAHHASFWISSGTVATPTITPAGGAYLAAPLVSMATTTSDATVRYTLDGTMPGAHSPVFGYPFLLPTTTTVKARAFKPGYVPSAVATMTYELDAAGAAATPVLTPGGGRFATTQSVTVTGVPGATVRYTIDGSDPTSSSPSIAPGAFLTVDKSQVVKVRAWAPGLEPSAVRRADFLITGAVAAGSVHSAVLKADGTVWTFGANYSSQIGDGGSSGTFRVIPVQVLTGGVAVAAGSAHTLTAKADGSLWSWGTIADGRLGRSTSGTFPAAISGFGDVVAVAAGDRHSLALREDGTVWAFGYNNDGQLGDGTEVDRWVPVAVPGLTGVVAIAASQNTSYALQSDGAGGGWVWAWGANGSGQLGDGSLLTRLTPTRVSGLANVRQIAVGGDSALAVAGDGRLFGWGRNDQGQLGLGTTLLQSTPQEVSPIRDVWTVAAGGRHGVVVDATARTWAWGENAGQLGTGQAPPTPSLVPEYSNFRGALTMSGGWQHTLAVMPDGTVFGAGLNNGRLGNGSTVSSAEPVAVSGLVLADGTWLTGDADRDGLPTWREYFLGSDPLNPDTNGNGILDGLDERSGVSVTNPDLDADGVPNWTERAQGTDAFRADSDGDGVNDGADAFPLDPTRWQPLSPTPGDTTPPVITLTQPASARPIP